MESSYHIIDIAPHKYVIETIKTAHDIVVVIQNKNENVLNGIALAQKTVESIPSTTQIFGDVLDDESQSIAQLLSLKLQKRVTVSCNVTFSQEYPEKQQLVKAILSLFK
ncbi:hypothetical protein EIN_525270 [Entamoeba invadens IP1]|uniref:Proteasome assembly chaperone 3 n=1 Tax=Entamoeba invadens IP1 TaxID=370355 RepID=A0A0A1U5H5_ENTIV|nr:hypothetical protein EIN_525270 [Entamoeba invadens IP1]ELP89572.1 hypothetical protein EIN_525270 [Entamoeba invadens IP1]|eukprot:XP_004256343.1 hypothetical protein EIN_525270 [Entamoeba invadens IP1]